MKTFVFAVLIGIVMSYSNTAFGQGESDSNPPPLHTLWDYGDPVATRERFEAVRPTAEASDDVEYYLSLLTQMARTHGLEGRFEKAHDLLDTVKPMLTDSCPVARVNYLLERGRTYRSGGDVAKSVPLFQNAFELAKSTGQDYLAIDAAHMMALVDESPEGRRTWSQRGLELAETSADPRTINWRGSINNNIGWDYHDRGEFDSALVAFEKAVVARQEQGDAWRLRIARWSVGRALRSLERVDEALLIQESLDRELSDLDERDGYVSEELGELQLLKGDSAKAAVYFGDACRELSKDNWFVENESARLERMKNLGQIE